MNTFDRFSFRLLITTLILLLECSSAFVYNTYSSTVPTTTLAMRFHGMHENRCRYSPTISKSMMSFQVYARPLALKSRSGNVDDEQENAENNSSIEEELERLQLTLTTIEALEARNESQLESFVDEQDQWESMEEEERVLLQSKDEIVQRLDTLTTELMQMWMGAKSREG